MKTLLSPNRIRLVLAFAALMLGFGSTSAMAQQYQYSSRYYQPTYVQRAPAATYYRQAAPVQYQYRYQYQAAPAAAAPATVQYQYQTAAPAAAATYSGSDPYGFLNWLNATRASYGLSAVGYDSNLESWASANNAQQQARGLGHFVMGSARRQNSAMGHYGSIGSMWMNSPAHRAALLDPTIRMIGIAGLGTYWTFNAN